MEDESGLVYALSGQCRIKLSVKGSVRVVLSSSFLLINDPLNDPHAKGFAYNDHTEVCVCQLVMRLSQTQTDRSSRLGGAAGVLTFVP